VRCACCDAILPPERWSDVCSKCTSIIKDAVLEMEIADLAEDKPTQTPTTTPPEVVDDSPPPWE
jgi:hypothetical protein